MKLTKKKRVIDRLVTTLLVYAQCLCCVAPVLGADAMRLTGYLNVTGFDGFHKPITSLSSSNEFEIVLCRDGRQSIEVRSLAKATDISHLVYDGSATYCVRYRDTVFGRTNGRFGIVRSEPFTNHVNSACISAGAYPFDLTDEQARTRVLWLAFGAGIYLQRHPQGSMPLLWRFARWDPGAYGFRIEYELGDTSLPTLRSLKFIRSTALDLPDSAEFNRPELDRVEKSGQALREVDLQQRKNSWPNGFVAGLFRVSESTNYSDIELPLRFSLKAFSPLLNSDDRLARSFEGVVTAVSDLDSSQFSLPPIASRVLVVDERRRHETRTKKLTEVSYMLQPGGQWYAENASFVTNVFQAVLHSEASDKQRYVSSHARMLVTRVALAICLGLPLLIIVLFKFGSKLKS